LNELRPLIVIPALTVPHPGASRPFVSTTPGRVLSTPMKSRPLMPVSSICCCVINADRSPVVVCTLRASAWTEIVSVRPPTSRWMARSATRSVDERTMPFCS
jgi:hypothetical protein